MAINDKYFHNTSFRQFRFSCETYGSPKTIQRISRPDHPGPGPCMKGRIDPSRPPPSDHTISPPVSKVKSSPRNPSPWALREMYPAQAPACSLFMNCPKETRYLIFGNPDVLLSHKGHQLSIVVLEYRKYNEDALSHEASSELIRSI